MNTIEYKHALRNAVYFMKEHEINNILLNEDNLSLDELKCRVLETYIHCELDLQGIKALQIVLKYILQNF